MVGASISAPVLLPHRGLLVPQVVYGIHDSGGFGQEPPTMFVVDNQRGIPLQDAMEEKYEGLVGRDERMFSRCGSSMISCRIQV